MEICDRCGAVVEDGDIRYMVRIAVRVDDGGLIKQPITDEEMESIIKQMENVSAEDLEREVYEERSYILCPPCKRAFMKNPIGGGADEPADGGIST